MFTQGIIYVNSRINPKVAGPLFILKKIQLSDGIRTQSCLTPETGLLTILGQHFPDLVKDSITCQVTDDRNYQSRPVLQAGCSPTAWPVHSSWSNDRCIVSLTMETRNHSAG